MDNLEKFCYFILFAIIFYGIYYYFSSPQFQLKCVVSDVDGEKYCVRDRNRVKDAANLLATIANKCKDLVNFISQKYPEHPISKRLKDNFNTETFMETLPTSQYKAYSENKGEKLAFCLNKKNENDNNLIDEHTLTFVAIHELSHIGTKQIGHPDIFWKNFKWILEKAKEAGIHNPTDYSKKPVEFCDMTIKDNPFYDM